MTNPDSGNVGIFSNVPSVDQIPDEEFNLREEFCAGLSSTDSINADDVDFDLEQLLTRVVEDDEPHLDITHEETIVDDKLQSFIASRAACFCEYECRCSDSVIEFKGGKDKENGDQLARQAAAELQQIHYTQIIAAAKERGVGQGPSLRHLEAGDETTFVRKPMKLIKGDDNAVMKYRLIQMRRRKMAREGFSADHLDFWTMIRYRNNSMRSSQREMTKGLMRWFGGNGEGKLLQEQLERYALMQADAMAKQSRTWAGTYYFDAGMAQAYGY